MAPLLQAGLLVFRALLRCGFPAGPLISPALSGTQRLSQSSFIVCTHTVQFPEPSPLCPEFPSSLLLLVIPTPNQTTYRLGFEICTSWRGELAVSSAVSGFQAVWVQSVHQVMFNDGKRRQIERRARQKEDQKRGNGQS